MTFTSFLGTQKGHAETEIWAISYWFYRSEEIYRYSLFSFSKLPIVALILIMDYLHLNEAFPETHESIWFCCLPQHFRKTNWNPWYLIRLVMRPWFCFTKREFESMFLRMCPKRIVSVESSSNIQFRILKPFE